MPALPVVQLPDQDIIATAGCAAPFTVVLKDRDGTVVDGAGFTAVYVAVVFATGEERLRLDMSNGLSWTAEGALLVGLTDVHMAGLGGLALHHEVKVWDALGNPSHSMRGALIVRPSWA